jgi:hypothetical protein
MADRPIYAPQSPNTVPWIWGERHYFYNCHREGGDYGWHADNLSSAEGSPTGDQVTPAWTFDGRWDLEKRLPKVLPFVSMPSPRDGSYDVPHAGARLRWLPSRNSEASLVFFGKTSNPGYIRNQTENEFELGNLDPNTRYFWRIDEVVGQDTLRGPIWHFTTR